MDGIYKCTPTELYVNFSHCHEEQNNHFTCLVNVGGKQKKSLFTSFEMHIIHFFFINTLFILVANYQRLVKISTGLTNPDFGSL